MNILIITYTAYKRLIIARGLGGFTTLVEEDYKKDSSSFASDIKTLLGICKKQYRTSISPEDLSSDHC